MLCLTCGYNFGSAQESDDKEASEGKVGSPDGPKCGFGTVGAHHQIRKSTAAEVELRTTTHRDFARVCKSKKALTGLLLAGALFAAEPNTKPRPITYQDGGEIQTVYTSAGFTTELRLPKNEEIIFATGAQVCDPTKTQEACGYFGAIFNGRTVVVKYLGSEPGKRTDLRLLCRSGNEYTFLIQEVSRKATPADLIVLVSNGTPEAQAAMVAPPKLYTADEVDALKRDADNLRATLAKEQERSRAEISKAAMGEFGKLKCDYEFFDRKGEDFKPSACTDGKFTRVEVHSSEVPSFFEVKEGKLSLVQATFADGHYVIPKVLDQAELSIGKSRIKFRRIG